MKYLLVILSLTMIISTAFAVTAVDSAQTIISLCSYQCIKNSGYERVIIRGYFEAYCGSPGGAIDQTFAQSYTNAVDAGFTCIDVYMFPCTGKPKSCSSTCKTAQQQVEELISYVNRTKAVVRTAWLDIEVDPASNNWPDSVTNLQWLQDFHTAWQKTGWRWGIYTNKNQWGTITGDPNYVLDSNLPLWWPYFDQVINLTANFVPFGGWKKPTGKQYSGSDNFCNNTFDKSVF